MKTVPDCITYGRKWLESQNSAEAVYTCASRCEVRADGSSTCNRLCEYDRKSRKCQDKKIEIPKRQAATPKRVR